MRWDENAGGSNDAISTSSRPHEQESAARRGSDSREKDGLGRPLGQGRGDIDGK
jgi:hypothetical protein